MSVSVFIPIFISIPTSCSPLCPISRPWPWSQGLAGLPRTGSLGPGAHGGGRARTIRPWCSPGRLPASRPPCRPSPHIQGWPLAHPLRPSFWGHQTTVTVWLRNCFPPWILRPLRGLQGTGPTGLLAFSLRPRGLCLLTNHLECAFRSRNHQELGASCPPPRPTPPRRW